MSVRSFYRPLYSANQMRAIDTAAIEGLGIPSIDLMEQAGRASAEIIADLYREWCDSGEVLILCGAGHNGGDGLVVARYLKQAGLTVRVAILAAEDRFKGDPAKQLAGAREEGIEPDFEPGTPTVPAGTALIVDALLGTGSTGALREPFAAWADCCNRSGVPIVAVDAPSGVDLDGGRVEGDAFRARATIALAELKTGYFNGQAREYTGRVYPVDIGIPAAARETVGTDRYLITPAGVSALLPVRPSAGHKGTFGQVAVIGGTQGMTGAVVLASLAALRTGCGLVHLGVPSGIHAICEEKATEVITHPLPDVKGRGVLALRAAGAARRLAGQAQVCVLGCGAGRHHETRELIGRLVESVETPLVLDADGLFPFGSDPDRLVRHRAPMIITPHPGELAHLLDVAVADVQRDRPGFALRAARHFDCVCVLKGALTVVATITGQTYVNPTGNSGMGTAGSGDVLAGTIGSLLAQGMSVLGAATAGVFLHGLAGDLAALERGERGMIASDLLETLPEALLAVEDRTLPTHY